VQHCVCVGTVQILSSIAGFDLELWALYVSWTWRKLMII